VKGAPDVISDGTRTTLNTHHHPAMTVGGVGDVLAGVTGALLGQGVPAPFAARLAAYWVGDAGQRAAGERGFGLVATDVVEALPEALVDGLRRVRPAT
jgi:NAD(P)H-hydrate epimerase